MATFFIVMKHGESVRDLGPSQNNVADECLPHRYEDEISKRTDLEFTFVQLKKVTTRA